MVSGTRRLWSRVAAAFFKSAPGRPPPLAGLAALGLALCALAALGAPALRVFGDNAFCALALASGGLAAWAARLAGTRGDGRTLALILGFALLMRLIVLPVEPLLSDDVYRYVWDGRVQAAGVNPYRYVPADPALAALRDLDIFPRINRADYAVTIYPPVAQAFFWLVTRLSESVLAMKAALVCCEAVIVAAVVGLLRRLGQPEGRVAAYAWHPLPVWEIANNGHVDALMAALAMAGIWLAVARGRALWGAAAVTLGALVKPLALLALPPLWKPFDWRTPLVAAAVVVLAYAPYLAVGTGVLGFLAGGYLAEERIDTGGGFWLLTVWRALFGAASGDVGVYLALAGLALIALALRAGFRGDRAPAVALADINRLLLVFLVLLSPDYPWYFLLAAPFLALVGGAPGWALTVGGFMLYDVATGDPQIPFFVRDAVFNGLVLAAAALAWLRRSRAFAGART